MAGQLHFYYPLEEGSRFLEESTHSCIFGVAKCKYETHILFEQGGINVYYTFQFKYQIYIFVSKNCIYQYSYVARTIHKIILGKPQYALQLWTSRNVIQVLFSQYSIFYTLLYECTCIEGYIKQNCLSFLAQSLQPRKKNGSWATYFVGLYLTAGMIINGSVNLSSLHSVLDIQNQNRNLKTQNVQKLIKY